MTRIAFVVAGLFLLARPGIAQQASNPHGALALACSTCHAPDGWKPAKVSKTFKHAPTTFPLEGAHVQTSCLGCHKQLDFKGVSAKCASCHEDVHKGELGADCARCHTPRSFAEEPAMKQAHELTRFPLRGAHATVRCSACHTPSSSGQLQFVGRSTTCQGCHATDARAVAAPTHAGPGFTDCASCHSINTWRNARFDHSQTAFPLVGAHQAATCEGCHADRVFKGKSMQCVSCHRADYDQATKPRHADGFPTTCADCHSNTDWKGATFDHQVTRFPLSGAHNAVACTACHGDQVFQGKSMECMSCHRTAFQATTNPPHGNAAFSAPCTACHTTTAWSGATFNHEVTRFPLSGAHRTTSCAGCHADKVFAGKPTTCVSCHRGVYDAAKTPPHGGFPVTCESCHATSTWTGATFDHSATDFPLTGGHRAATCAGCHSDGVFNGKPTDCVSCHRARYDATTTPPHAATGLPTTCATCHTTTTWVGAFDHSTTQFPLTGAHRTATCLGCHADGVYRGKPSDCYSCHRTAYDGTRRPPHGASAIGTTCTSCHTTTAWAGGTYDHSVTSFPLTGAHRAASCNGCHADGVYNNKPTDCVSCHRARYDATTTPPHAATGYSTTCTTCHSTTTWLGAVFNHSTTQFPLTGAHVTATCQRCHADGVYRGKPTDCYSCHRTAYDGTRSPPHGASAIGTACTSCHTTTAWAGGTYDHNVTSFPLTGAHRAASCNGCHADGVYKGKSTACLSCHQADYTATTRPPHGSSGIGTVCSSCHSTTAWIPGSFNHSATNFPLTGAHTATSCLSCHGDGVYRGKNTACVSCHQADYTATTNPNHAAASFPTTCSSCHTTTTWLGATFNHDGSYFPIYSGAHAGKWSSCATCHTSPTNYKAFTCLSCHEHRQSEMDSKHQGRTGYRYDSQACYACHPRGTH